MKPIQNYVAILSAFCNLTREPLKQSLAQFSQAL